MPPIISRAQMIELLTRVSDKRMPVLVAVAKIEAWADDFASRNALDQKRRAGIVTIDDGPRRPSVQ